MSQAGGVFKINGYNYNGLFFRPEDYAMIINSNNHRCYPSMDQDMRPYSHGHQTICVWMRFVGHMCIMKRLDSRLVKCQIANHDYTTAGIIMVFWPEID